MANPEHLAKLKEGLAAWNRWRWEHPTVMPDLDNAESADVSMPYCSRVELSYANLSMASLKGVRLREAYLNEADLSRADLKGADLGGADLVETDLSNAKLGQVNFGRALLRGACLNGAELNGAELYGADFTGADLRGANLSDARLTRTDLWGTDLTAAWVGNTTFTSIDLSGVKGLETVKHYGPSSIGIDTIYKSKGKIPHIFLRGCGVPDNFIAYIPSLINAEAGIEFYSLFISYSTKDQEFAERLHADLQAKGVRCWFAPAKLRGGNWLDEQLEGAIRAYDKLLLILSEASMASDWVKWELSNAVNREEKEGKRVLFPIRLCSYDQLDEWKCPGRFPGDDLAPAVRRYFIPDFRNWKDHDAYKLAFDRLLHDLKGKPEPASA